MVGMDVSVIDEGRRQGEERGRFLGGQFVWTIYMEGLYYIIL